jgi:flagellar motor switch protein FliN
MNESLSYLDCWTTVAASLFSQALAGEPTLSESLPKPRLPGSFAFAATIEGDEAGRFVVTLDPGLATSALLGEGVDAQAGWLELLREVAEAATGELLAKTGRKCRVVEMQPVDVETRLTRCFELKTGDRAWSIHVLSEMRPADTAPTPARAAGSSKTKTPAATPSKPPAAAPSRTPASAASASSSAAQGASSPHASGSPASSPVASARGEPAAAPATLSPALELLLDVELEASLRFGAREMPLGEILDLGPGDVIQLDRHVSDPVDLIVGDKIVARGEVVLVNGNFGLRVTEVAEPQRRLESIRCLF